MLTAFMVLRCFISPRNLRCLTRFPHTVETCHPLTLFSYGLSLSYDIPFWQDLDLLALHIGGPHR
jgi:hypothetical protein